MLWNVTARKSQSAVPVAGRLRTRIPPIEIGHDVPDPGNMLHRHGLAQGHAAMKDFPRRQPEEVVETKRDCAAKDDKGAAADS